MTNKSEQIRPMLAAKYDEARALKHLKADGYLYIQPKVDGMRVLFHEGVARSRSWKPWTNKALQQAASSMAYILDGLDGEMLPGKHLGRVIDPEAFRTAMSELRAMEGAKEFTYFVFDYFDSTCFPCIPSFEMRYNSIANTEYIPGTYVNTIQSHDFKVHLVLCPTYKVSSIEEIKVWEADFLARGFEGAILRRWNGHYKFGRATPLGGELTKIKQFEDDEAIIVGYEVAYENQNDIFENELGLSSRSAHQANLVPKDYLGSITVELLNDRSKQFNIGVMKGFTIGKRKELWQQRENLIDKIVTFKHQGYAGGYDLPRTPVLISFRASEDL